VICSGCGAVLYEGEELIPPDEVIHRYDGRCPSCGRKLSITPVSVEVEAASK